MKDACIMYILIKYKYSHCKLASFEVFTVVHLRILIF